MKTGLSTVIFSHVELHWMGLMVEFRSFMENQTLNSSRWRSQTNLLKAAIDEKRPELVNCFDQIHVYLQIWQKLVQLSWDVLLHRTHLISVALVKNSFKSLHNSLEENFNPLKSVSKFCSGQIQRIKSLWKTVTVDYLIKS